MTSALRPVTVLGLGNMGFALAAALLDRGHPVTVWNRSPHKAVPLTDRGASLAATPAEAIAASPARHPLRHRLRHAVCPPRQSNRLPPGPGSRQPHLR